RGERMNRSSEARRRKIRKGKALEGGQQEQRDPDLNQPVALPREHCSRLDGGSGSGLLCRRGPRRGHFDRVRGVVAAAFSLPCVLTVTDCRSPWVVSATLAMKPGPFTLTLRRPPWACPNSTPWMLRLVSLQVPLSWLPWACTSLARSKR